MPIGIGLNIDTSAFDRMVSRLASSVNAGTTNPNLRNGAQAGMQVYMGAMRRRYSAASGNDGTWPDIKPVTKLKRFYKAGGKMGRVKGSKAVDRIASVPYPILYDSGKLYNSMVPGEAGNIFEVLTDRVRSGSAVSYAKYHQTGGARLPQRAILVQPAAEVVAQMVAPVREGLVRVVSEASGG